MIISVADMKPNQRGMIVRIEVGHGRARQLTSMGLRPGVMITKTSGQPFRGPVTIQVGGTEAAFGFGIARRIMVEVPG